MSQVRTGSTTAAPRRGSVQRRARVLLLLGLPILVVAFVAALAYNNRQSAEPVASSTATLIRPDSPILGAAEAPVTIVEFLDPECESCRAAFPFVKQLLQEYDGRVRLVVRYFPLHANSVLAVAATEAAGEQGKYWEMQELLFNNQLQWGEQQSPQTELFVSYAEQLGLDSAAFTAGLQKQAFIAKAERDRQDGIALGVQGTPTFFINGKRVEELNADAIVDMIEQELAQ